MNLPNDLDLYKESRYYFSAAEILDRTRQYEFIKARIFYLEIAFPVDHPLRQEFEVAKESWYRPGTDHETRILFLLFLDTIILSGDSLQ